ncbi:hypothetical protein [Orenia marismortui]|uniref:Uncharacterized protein n=1 Tax=Orenia marismortui TaxID=46469 RepID=A0A4R8GMW1_9FIRM|nr:hypothetical protein [Orenia marismortui]TDX44584.1 hypothetical protein C7959_1508 [Orenia marismortui]
MFKRELSEEYQKVRRYSYNLIGILRELDSAMDEVEERWERRLLREKYPYGLPPIWHITPLISNWVFDSRKYEQEKGYILSTDLTQEQLCEKFETILKDPIHEINDYKICIKEHCFVQFEETKENLEGFFSLIRDNRIYIKESQIWDIAQRKGNDRKDAVLFAIKQDQIDNSRIEIISPAYRYL